ncbi:MAG: ribonuclease P protein component [Chloroflexi bacterium]|nr:ribonuclease P protein component [Chloroflexota bacterium]
MAATPAPRQLWSLQRLRRRQDFLIVQQQGRSWANSLLVLKAHPNGTAQSRIGLVVSKRIGKAVVRNRVKRRLRELLRPAPLRPGWDVVVTARPPAARATWQQLRGSVDLLLRRAGLLLPATADKLRGVE